ncbi:hypothetical protein PAXRUDRAFT_30397 [Paxillus rubicundulus Ve08.2h10]|uniref:Transcription factor CBF/NF-Y/archaeal histone domain-containing protein n=1 Tax=Paxillus rubicundulus Ve08.2h10 TaxID=930991 RepID=A0A0D0ECM7_9AGAM|nr:hypothetical protein PAXRUDRAFT_30397 [Paxillus rubicundulus Ve08.2h10]
MLPDDPSSQFQGSSIYNLPTDSEGEAEVDELESDTEDEPGASASATASQKKAGKRVGERVPGSTLLPISRVENIIQADGITSNLSMSKEAAFVLSIAAEEFIKRMAQAGHRQASATCRNIVNYTDMASSTQQYQEFMFLQDTIPEPMSLSAAIDRRQAKEKEDLETNPAMSSTINPQSTPPAPMFPGSQLNGKSKVKSCPSNRKEKANTSASASSQGDHRKQPMMNDRPDDPLSTNVVRSSSGRVIRSTRATRQGMGDDASGVMNGSTQSREEDSWSGSTSPRRPSASHQSPYDIHDSTPQSFAPPWPGQFTGPASGFLQDPQGTFGRMTQNPGRTIYSQQSRPENVSQR